MYIAIDMKMRKYDMGARQDAKDATRNAVVQAAVDEFMAERSFAITLPAIAERAGVTVKTVLRHFGNREALIDATWARVYDDVVAERTPTSDTPEAALRVLITHYERRGDMVLALLAQQNDPRADTMNDAGRLGHRAWIEEVFDARLPDDPDARSRIIDLLVVATDVYCWKLLRRDRVLSVDDVCDRMLFMTNAVLGAS